MNKHTIKFLVGSLLVLPVASIMWLQGRRIKNKIPDLPEATGSSGICQSSSNEAKKILVIGESTMAGVGVETHQEGFAGTLAQELSERWNSNIEWKVHAKSGITARRVTQEIVPYLAEPAVDLIVVGLGGNDAFALHSPNRWQKDIRALITSLQAKFEDVPIVFANMPPIREFPAFTRLMQWVLGNLVELLGEALSDVVLEFDKVYYSPEVITIDKWTKKLNIEPDVSKFFSDGVHPSKLTYQTLAKDLAAFICFRLPG